MYTCGCFCKVGVAFVAVIEINAVVLGSIFGPLGLATPIFTSQTKVARKALV